MLNDLRHAARLLLRDKGWTAVVVLSLAVGIGANTAIFTAVNGLFLRKVQVADPDTLVRLKWAGRNDMATDTSDYGFSTPLGQRDTPETRVRATFSYPMYLQFRADNRTMTDLFACAPLSRANVVVDGRADIAAAFLTTGNYYQVLGLHANPGRTIVPDDDRSGAAPVAVISARYWRSRFGADPSAIGKAVTVNNVPVTIVGVIGPELVDLQQAVKQGPDIALPLSLVPQSSATAAAPGEPDVPLLERPTYWWLQVVGRARPGVTPQQVQANLEAVFQHTARAGFDAFLSASSPAVRAQSRYQNRIEVPRLIVEPGSKGIYDVNTNDARTVAILSVVVGLTLLIVCANVANLLLSRATARRREVLVRLSLGATRARLVRQLLTESVVLASIGAALGALLAFWGRQLLPIAAGQPAPFDWRVLTFVAAVALATGVIFGVAPALRATTTDVSGGLKETSRTVAASRGVLAKALLVVQVAVSLVLLIGAGLFVRTLQNLRGVDVGFNTRNVVLFRVSPMLNQYDEPRTAALYQQLIDRIRAVPGVASVGVSHIALLAGSTSSTSIFVQGRTYVRGQGDPINRLTVSAGFFETLQMPIRAGRGITERDTAASPKVVVINETAARKYFPNENPIGRRFGTRPETAGQLEIVGVVRDAKYNSVRDPAPPTMYLPYLQAAMPSAVFEVRTAGEPVRALGAIREAVRQVDPALPMMNVSTQSDEVEQRLQAERLFARACTLFGVLALVIASIGLFGVMSYSVARRTNEIGIRMALGARAADVLALVMGESMRLVAAGAAIGVLAAIGAGRLVSALLYGLAPTDTLTIAGAAAILVTVAALAGYFPARRAASVDPLTALRYE